MKISIYFLKCLLFYHKLDPSMKNSIYFPQGSGHARVKNVQGSKTRKSQKRARVGSLKATYDS